MTSQRQSDGWKVVQRLRLDPNRTFVKNRDLHHDLKIEAEGRNSSAFARQRRDKNPDNVVQRSGSVGDPTLIILSSPRLAAFCYDCRPHTTCHSPQAKREVLR